MINTEVGFTVTTQIVTKQIALSHYNSKIAVILKITTSQFPWFLVTAEYIIYREDSEINAVYPKEYQVRFRELQSASPSCASLDLRTVPQRSDGKRQRIGPCPAGFFFCICWLFLSFFLFCHSQHCVRIHVVFSLTQRTSLQCLLW